MPIILSHHFFSPANCFTFRAQIILLVILCKILSSFHFRISASCDSCLSLIRLSVSSIILSFLSNSSVVANALADISHECPVLTCLIFASKTPTSSHSDIPWQDPSSMLEKEICSNICEGGTFWTKKKKKKLELN